LGVFQLNKSVLAGSLAFIMLGVQAQPQAGQQDAAHQSIPEAPRPQTPLPGLDAAAPGRGAVSTSSGETPPAGSQTTPASTAAPQATPQTSPQGQAPIAPEDLHQFTLPAVQVNYVEIPFTVKDSKGQSVAGIMPEEVEVYENNVKQDIRHYTVDAWPLSVAIVIDQSMTPDDMVRVNDALGALPDAFSKYDEVSVYTYNSSTKQVTDFTGAQSTRLADAVLRAKAPGREPFNAGDLGGPMSCTTCINNQNVDPNTSANRGHTSVYTNVPREVHTLNDAILRAATALSNRPTDRRRVIYVISDGKEYGSKAKTKDVIQYLQTHRIEVDGTLVGDSAETGMGILDHIHLPLMMRDNILIAYKDATGGNFDAEFRTSSIEKSFARIAAEVRDRYTLGYYTHEPLYDGKFRPIEVKVLRPNLTVIAPKGYYPWMETTARPTPASQ
jgi:VWFA-related protein